ncbi:LytTR family DNA-binding domain-containing protein [Ekhidna sp.]|uniref:LytR/AlgR family response regulator transcription factor n=1 Tax=Ekhidna sp. TaxID=2608089 RepID=UPI00329A0C7D
MSNQLKTIVVDDDKFQLEIISTFVKNTQFLSLEGAFNDPMVGLDAIIGADPDLLLLDVEMPKLSGFDLIKSLKHVPQTIIITGKKDYAVEAFELDVLDYLVKPIDDYVRFLKAVTKAKENHTSTDGKVGESIYVRDESLLVNIKTKDILYFEAFGDYVKIGTQEKIYVIHSTLSKIESRLNDEFIRVHRSFIVRLDKIKNIDQGNLQIGEKILPISQSMRPKLMSKISTF